MISHEEVYEATTLTDAYHRVTRRLKSTSSGIERMAIAMRPETSTPYHALRPDVLRLVEQESMTTRPAPSEHAPYYAKYISLIGDGNILTLMRTQFDETMKLFRSIPEAQSTILHPPYTWTLKQVIGHLTDGERVFAYRALRIARGDATPLPGFDENQYALADEFERLRLRQVIDEFESVRRATITLFENLDAQSWKRLGEANGNPVSVRAIAYIIVGHVRHHAAIIQKRLHS